MIPEITKQTIDDYVAHGLKPGGFVTAVLANDLMEAFGKADLENRRAMFSIVEYVHNHVPYGLTGSYGAVCAHCQRKHRDRVLASMDGHWILKPIEGGWIYSTIKHQGTVVGRVFQDSLEVHVSKQDRYAWLAELDVESLPDADLSYEKHKALVHAVMGLSTAPEKVAVSRIRTGPAN